jgi:hypothetical protein
MIKGIMGSAKIFPGIAAGYRLYAILEASISRFTESG